MAAERSLEAHIQGLPAEQAGLLRFFRALRKKPLGMGGAAVVLIIFLVGLTAPLIAPYDPTAVVMGDRLQGPSLSHPIGTDQIGRDILTRLMYGARVSLTISLSAVGVGATIGALLGMLSGYFRGRFDFILQRVMDMMQAFPLLIMALTIVALLGASTRNVIIAIAIVLVPSYNRLVRGSTLATVNYPYIEAARSVGATHVRILARHILPNITAPLIVLMTASFGGAILVETSLTFLGLGASPTEPTWGGMLSVEGRSFWEQAPWMAIAPGVAISLTVLGYNLLGDALRDIWDPALRGR
jgi:peptide/nickel transport system permease protein